MNLRLCHFQIKQNFLLCSKNDLVTQETSFSQLIRVMTLQWPLEKMTTLLTIEKCNTDFHKYKSDRHWAVLGILAMLIIEWKQRGKQMTVVGKLPAFPKKNRKTCPPLVCRCLIQERLDTGWFDVLLRIIDIIREGAVIFDEIIWRNPPPPVSLTHQG